MKKHLLTLILVLLSLCIYSQGIITHDNDSKYYQVRKYTRYELGIKFPYTIAYVWRYTYVGSNGAIVKRMNITVGENSNKFIPHTNPLSISCEVTSYHHFDEFITGIIYDEFFYYPNDISLEKIDTSLKKVKKQ